MTRIRSPAPRRATWQSLFSTWSTLNERRWSISRERRGGRDLLRAQWRWPAGMPLCRPMGNGLWEIRTDLPTKRTARVLLCLYREHLVALHGFIKKTRATPDEDFALARKRKKELEQ